MEQLTILNQISFWMFAGLMVFGALGVVFHRSIVYSAILLLVTFLAIAGFFVLLNAPFIAAAQVLVYGVGLTIVMLFGIMLTGDQPFKDAVGHERPRRFWLIPGVVASAFMGFLLWAILYPNFQLTMVRGLFGDRMDGLSPTYVPPGIQAVASDGGAVHIGQLLFSTYIVPFELASILLLLAMVGAIILSKRQLPEEEGESPLGIGYPEEGGRFEEAGFENACALSDEEALTPVGAHTAAGEQEKETLGVH